MGSTKVFDCVMISTVVSEPLSAQSVLLRKPPRMRFLPQQVFTLLQLIC